MSNTAYNPHPPVIQAGSITAPAYEYASVPPGELGVPNMDNDWSASRTTLADGMAINRGGTPPPNKEEQKALRSSMGIDLQSIRHPESWRDLVPAFVIAFILVIVIVTEVFKKQILEALAPAATWLLATPGGWAIPIGILVVMSFPPLFGHEFVAIFCGMVWGPGIGFGIVCAGTIVGETLMFLIFKYALHSYGERAQRKSISFAAFCNVIRKGGFRVILASRFSAVPPHFTTAVYATCQVKLWQFLLAAVLSLPKQLASVFIGYDLKLSADGQSSKLANIVTYAVLGITVVVTIAVMRHLRQKTAQETEAVVYQRRKARQAAELKSNYTAQPYDPYYNGGSDNGHARQASTAHLLGKPENSNMV
ncbi:hypothetical protein CONPUDRAFT_110730 [Coniophora puteana RWD-64-598 SS2]|uniref:Golgi apparatus membrane protein TVP38 n=1 Tax=Coniophora puteana (strain RWD-64-598) TaxID=741705 RepID=A0A5M3MCP2_CONPW|nr:uncharacterized protein CONPUDRAFT_110730 [Coniophora puteana RWD-64-598 SS2]EIW76978.1 hypothetical protein CONPUDRAFT_110730 [Coniophora puteana RWD-64-598 SS2]